MSNQGTQYQKKDFALLGTGGAVGAIITALLMQNCDGKKDYTSNNDAGVTDAGAYDASTGDAGVPKCSDIKGCYDQKHVDNLTTKLNKCQTNSDSCLEENYELSKQPRKCPTYTPKACPEVEECPQMPYIRKGE